MDLLIYVVIQHLRSRYFELFLWLETLSVALSFNDSAFGWAAQNCLGWLSQVHNHLISSIGSASRWTLFTENPFFCWDNAYFSLTQPANYFSKFKVRRSFIFSRIFVPNTCIFSTVDESECIIHLLWKFCLFIYFDTTKLSEKDKKLVGAW